LYSREEQANCLACVGI